METHQKSETVVSTVLTLQGVLSAGAGELNQDQFAILANNAKDEAVKAVGISKKYEVFTTTLLANCEKFGDKIPRRFWLVGEGTNAKVWFNWPGARLTYWANGADGYIYAAAVYPN